MAKEEATIQSLLCHIEALEETIKALEQECCEDCVSRAELLKYNTVCIDDSGVNRFCVPTQIVKTLPPVTPTRKKGKWTNGDPICPCCGEDKFKGLDADIWADWQPKYCPNCGAEMESDK